MGIATSTAHRLTCDGVYCRAETPIARTRAAAIIAGVSLAWRIEHRAHGALSAWCSKCRGANEPGIHFTVRTSKAVAQ